MGESAVVQGSLDGMEGVTDALSEAQLKAGEARRVFEAGLVRADGGPGYEAAEMADYWRLVERGWTWRQAVFVLWSATPHEHRWPATQEALAREVLGLASDRVIRTWKAKNPMIEEEIAAVARGALVRHRADVIAALVESARNPSPRAHADRRTFLEMTGDYVPRQVTGGVQVVATVDDLRGMSDAELARMGQEVGVEVREQGEGEDE